MVGVPVEPSLDLLRQGRAGLLHHVLGHDRTDRLTYDWECAGVKFPRASREHFQHDCASTVQAENALARQPVGVSNFAEEYVANGHFPILALRQTILKQISSSFVLCA
jgi:hypothetical protein